MGAGALAFVLAFVWAAATRRLNFDESLALRAGWLMVDGTPGSPDFYMPWTWALGQLAHVVEDPHWVFLGARIFVVTAVLGSLIWAMVQTKVGTATVCGAVALTCVQVAFAVHGYEFRYDAAILAGWLLGFGMIVRRDESDYVVLGICAAWLAAHHVKGVFFAVGLLGFCVARAVTDGGKIWPRLARLSAGFGLTAAAWIAITVMLGFGDDLLGVWATFTHLGVQGARVPPWTELDSSVARDTVWWILAAAAFVWTLTRLRRLPTEQRVRDWRLWAIGFAAWPLVFTVMHPHPWQYMLAVPAPFLALLLARAINDVAGNISRRTIFGVVGAGIIAYAAGAAEWPGTAYVMAARSPNTRQVETLRLLRRVALPQDRILDPSGLAYFHPPCNTEWYI